MSWKEVTAADVMTATVITLDDSMSLRSAAQNLLDERISGALVTDGTGTPVGVISLVDLLAFASELEAGPIRGFYGFGAGGADDDAEGDGDDEDDEAAWASAVGRAEDDLLEATTVSEVMNPEVIAISASAPLAEVAQTMRARKVHRVLVTGDDGGIVGLISALDVVGAVAADG